MVINASGPMQLALDDPQLKHGSFTHYLLRGLGGVADGNGDGIVTVNELYSYVQRTVSEHAGAVGDTPLVQLKK